ncbi:MAG: hypothetical protein ACTHME_09030 [Candidatus Nitrosocosmicus sp.]
MEVKDLKIQLTIKSQKLLKEIEEKKDIFIYANKTVDGLISAAIIMRSVFNNAGNATIRCVSEGKIENSIEEIFNEKHDFYIFTDFDTYVIEIIEKIFDKFDNYLFINTDLMTKPVSKTYEKIINPWLFEIKGHEEINSSGLAYLLIKNFDRNSNKMSYLPIISAISKNQDIGEDRTLVGLNNEILQTALRSYIIEQKKRLDISYIENVPLTKCLENNTVHYIKEITWNNTTSSKIIRDSQIQINDEEGKIKLFKELDEKESMRIYESILRFMEENTKLNNNKIVKELLFGYSYILNNEEDEGYLKNAKSFVKVIDLCIKGEKNALALSICLGDRGSKILNDIHELLINYNSFIKKTSSRLFSEKWRFYDDRKTVFINGEGIIDSYNVNSFILFLERSISFADRLICLRIIDSEEYYKIILTKTKFCNIDLENMQEKIKEITDKENTKLTDTNKIEIKILASNLEDFLSNIKKIIMNEHVS